MKKQTVATVFGGAPHCGNCKHAEWGAVGRCVAPYSNQQPECTVRGNIRLVIEREDGTCCPTWEKVV